MTEQQAQVLHDRQMATILFQAYWEAMRAKPEAQRREEAKR